MKATGVIYQNNFSQSFIIVETPSGKHHVAPERGFLLPGHHRCMAVQGAKVQFDLQRGPDRSKLHAVNLQLVGEFELPERELSQVQFWKPTGSYGVLQRECGCSIMCRYDAFGAGTARHVELAPGEFVEHSTTFTDRGWRATDAVLNPREVSPDVNKFCRYDPQVVAQPQEIGNGNNS
jgi:cold shock CspA family protein